MLALAVEVLSDLSPTRVRRAIMPSAVAESQFSVHSFLKAANPSAEVVKRSLVFLPESGELLGYPPAHGHGHAFLFQLEVLKALIDVSLAAIEPASADHGVFEEGGLLFHR
jgi:hypothetical protein